MTRHEKLQSLVGKKIIRVTVSEIGEGLRLICADGTVIEAYWCGTEGRLEINGLEVPLDKDSDN